MKRLSLILLLAGFSIWGPSAVMAGSSESYIQQSEVISGGGGASGSASYNNVATIGQSSPLGQSSSENFINAAGFWQAGTVQHLLQITTAGTGTGTVTVNPGALAWNGGTGTAYYQNGAQVSLLAIAGDGSQLTGWSGDPDCVDEIVTMDRDKYCTATFDPAVYALTITRAGEGTVTSSPAGIDCGTDCAESYPSGSVITLGATPAAGYSFSGWSGDPDCADGVVTMNANRTCIATFSPLTFILTVTTGGTGTGTATGAGEYTYGTVVGLTAMPNEGSIFSSWSGDPDCADGMVTMTASTSCIAIFADISGPSLSLSMLPDGATTSNAVLNITGTLADPNGVQSLLVSGASVTITDDGFNTALVLNPGANVITIQATDQLDNQTTESRTITFDASAPQLTVAVPADNSIVAASVLTVAGSIAGPDITVDVRVNNGPLQAALVSGQAYTALVILSPGMNTVEVIATDLTGSRNQHKRTVVSDSQGVGLAISAPNEDVRTNSKNIVIRGSAADIPAEASITLEMDGLITTPTISGGQFEQDVSFAAEKTYAVLVAIQDGGGNPLGAVQRNIIYEVLEITVASDVASPRTAGTPVTFTAGASGGSGAYEYKFLYKLSGATTWTVARRYASAATWLWNTTGMTAGSYAIQVWVRNAGSAAAYEAVKTIGYTLTPPAATGATLFAGPTSPQTVGTAVAFMAGGEGGSGTYEYQFLYKLSTDPTMTVALSYSTSNTWNWLTSGAAPGSYIIQVHVRSAGSAAPYEAIKTIGYTLKVPPAADAALTPVPSSPRFVGTPVTFIAMATGGTGTYEYQFLYKKSTDPSLIPIQGYSPANTWSWSTGGEAAGSYVIQVRIRNAGSTAGYETLKTIGYTLK